MKVPGFLASSASCGIKKDGKPDLGLIYSPSPAKAAATFTTNVVKAAPVLVGMERIGAGLCQAIIVNSGNANAFSGPLGMEDALDMASVVARELGIAEGHTFPCSTGVIGIDLPVEKIRASVPGLVSGLSEDGLEGFARAIMTTDAFPKMATRTARVEGMTGTIAVVGKGAGMIEPNMATMLAYALTDIDIDPGALPGMLKHAVDATYNKITVDGDTSTNDSVFLLSSGALGNAPVEGGTPGYGAFLEALVEANGEVAEMIVRDGEGATKVLKIVIRGARTTREADAVARTIGNSLLVKTALFGEDANWGRFIAAAGRAGVAFDPDKVDLDFDDHRVLETGRMVGDEESASAVFKKPSFTVTLDLKTGDATTHILACDISMDYIKLNAHYRT